MTDTQMPRSIAKLTTLWNMLITSDDAKLAKTADGLKALTDEASPHDLDNVIKSTGHVAWKDNNCLMTVYLSRPPTTQPQHKQNNGTGGLALVHPAIAALHNTAGVISTLNGVLRIADHDGDWHKVAATGAAMIEVLQLATRLKSTNQKLDEISYGRIPQALPQLHQNLENAVSGYRAAAREADNMHAVETAIRANHGAAGSRG
ncbi:MAG: hypothetical protein OXG35_21345 [Acidobacteria bacterium]|nr:hypothetical protein [Acidobacteriota bacterium]